MTTYREALHAPIRPLFSRGALVCCLALGALLMTGCGFMRVGSFRSIPRDPDTEKHLPAHAGGPHLPQALEAPEVPPHPYMAAHGASNMHVDSFTTNTYAWAGPLGHAPEVTTRANGFVSGECPTVNFDREGRIVTVCVRYRTPHLLLLDPHTLTVIDRYELPARRTPLLGIRRMMEDTSGGAYFYLDHKDRAVVGTADGTIDIIAVHGRGSEGRFKLEERIDLSSRLRLQDGELDKITAVLPDYQGNYWVVARYGTIAVVTPKGEVRTLRLEGEEIENSLSIGTDAAYVVTDHALYRFELDARSQPFAVWRATYDRGTRRKVGQVNQGSGTTPTLLGDEYVAIADNAEPRMNVLVYRRAREAHDRLVCKVPVFEPGRSATENTMIGHGRSLIVENNAGYDLFTTMRGGKTSAPGLARIDVNVDGTGCHIVWESQEISQTTVPKLSAATGLVYLYTKLPNAPGGADAYYFTAIDFETGRTVYRVLTGTGMRFDNNWAAISLAKDGTAYVGVLNGLVRVRDTRQPDAAELARSPKPATPEVESAQEPDTVAQNETRVPYAGTPTTPAL